MIRHQKLYNGVRVLGEGPCLTNVRILDESAIPMVSFMQRAGLQVDLDHFAQMEKTLSDDMQQITEDVRALTGYYINLDSPDQVSDLLFNPKKLGLKQARRKLTTSGDRESVAEEILTAIQHDHPVIHKIQDHRELSKLLGTYVIPMPKLAVKDDGLGKRRMHPKLGQTRIPSGRFQCREPNLLAMPSRTERGREIRNGFITDPGWSFLSVDFSQIEVRMAAHSSKDTGLIELYQRKEDIYSDFATTAFNLRDERFQDVGGKWMYPTVDPMEHRYPAKTCILASIYDVSAPGLLEQMPVICKNCNLPASEHTCHKFVSLWNEDNCQDLINAFYSRYPGVMRDRKFHHARARRFGYCWDMFGRILHVAAVRSVHPWVVSAALREVGNFIYQASACALLKLVMAAIMDDIEDGHMLDVVHPLLPIHDEILSEVRNDVLEEFMAHMLWRFETVAKLEVPIKAGAATAEKWGLIAK